MNSLIKCLMTGFLLMMIGCEPESPADTDTDPVNGNIGWVVFDFPVANAKVPASGIRRIDLSLAKTNYDLMRGDMLISANVSDLERTYTFGLDPGDYVYQAGITCTCLGDTCLWGGFPGGRLGTKWTSGQITIVKGEKLMKNITFNK